MKAATATMILLAVLLISGGPAVAQGGAFGQPAPPKPEAKGKAEQEKAEQEKEKPPTPLERLLKDLQALVDREKARPEFDKGLVKDLEKLIKAFQKTEKPKVTLADLTEEDRERLKAELREEMAAERRGGGDGGGGGDWAARARRDRVEKALEGITLKESQRAKVEEMLGEFIDDSYSAYRNRDYGLVNDLKKDLEKRLRPVVGSKKARDIINNVNRSLPGRGRR